MEKEENEIKIEYNEINESDPLTEDLYVIKEIQSVLSQDVCETLNNGTEKKIELQLFHSTKTNQNLLNTQESTIKWFQSKDTNGKLICKYCVLKYSTVQTLRHHVRIKHPEEAKKLQTLMKNNKRNSKHICHICKTEFKNVTKLKLHVTLDHCIEIIKSSCIHCNATFINCDDLRQHMYIKHKKENELLYACVICGYRTSKKSHLKQHNNIHEQNKRMVCSYCDYKTNYLPNLRIHERIHTNDKPYVCDYKDCAYRSAAKSALRSHKLKHFPNENMLFCDKCSYKTVYKQSLKKHLDSHKRNFARETIM